MKRAFFGLIENVSPALADLPGSRTSILLDAVVARNGLGKFPPPRSDLYLARVQSTPNRISAFMSAQPEANGRPVPTELNQPYEGSWVQFTVGDRGEGPACWLYSASSNYERSERVSITSMTPITDPTLIARLDESCDVPAKTIELQDTFAKNLFHKIPDHRLRVVAIDVGQASCVAFYDRSSCVGFFVVGAPMPPNRKSFPKRLKLGTIPKRGLGFVLLSHWDFDHFALALKINALKKINWYAPRQKVGFNTAEFQRSLGSRLFYCTGDFVSKRFEFRKCKGPKSSDRNSNGYASRVQIGHCGILLPGDADYKFLPKGMDKQLSRIAIPHHAGPGDGPPYPRGGVFSSLFQIEPIAVIRKTKHVSTPRRATD